MSIAVRQYWSLYFSTSFTVCSPFCLMWLIFVTYWPNWPSYQMGLYLCHCTNLMCNSEFLCFVDKSCAFGSWSEIFALIYMSLGKDFSLVWIWIALCMYLLSSHSPIPHSLTLKVMNKRPSAESSNLLYCLHRGDIWRKHRSDHEHRLNSHCSVAQGYSGWWYSVFQPRRIWCGWWISLVLWKLTG